MGKVRWRSWGESNAIYRSLQSGSPKTAAGIASEIGITARSVRDALRGLKAKRLIYVAEWWAADACHQVPAYGFGSRPDAPKPAPKRLYHAERGLAYRRTRQVKEEETAELKMEQDKKRKAAEALDQPAFRHWMDIALFAEAA